MSSVTLQNLTSRFTPQQIVAMVNAQMAANANANANVMAQSYASNQPHALNQVQAGSQFQAVAQPQDMNNHSWKGKARAKGLKFHSVHANSKKKGALANPAMKLKKNSRPLNSFMAFRSKFPLLSLQVNCLLNISQAITLKSSRASSRRIFPGFLQHSGKLIPSRLSGLFSPKAFLRSATEWGSPMLIFLNS